MYKNNDEYWYEAPPLHKRIRKWFFWLGGWEKANSAGWRFYMKHTRPKKPTKEQREILVNLTPKEQHEYIKTLPERYERVWLSPFPISLLGHRITFYNWGMNIRTSEGYFCITWDKNQGRKCYISYDGTPSNAHIWYWGVPRDILKVARKRGETLKEFEERVKQL
jgi:hypothetical protein